MAQAQVDEHRGLVLGDGRVVDGADLGKLVGVHEVERGRAGELVGLKPCAQNMRRQGQRNVTLLLK